MIAYWTKELVYCAFRTLVIRGVLGFTTVPNWLIPVVLVVGYPLLVLQARYGPNAPSVRSMQLGEALRAVGSYLIVAMRNFVGSTILIGLVLVPLDVAPLHVLAIQVVDVLACVLLAWILVFRHGRAT